MDLHDDMWNEASNSTMSVLITIIGGIVAGLVASIIVKYHFKTTQERIYEKNRKNLIKIMLEEIYFPHGYVKEVFNLLETKDDFKPDTYFCSEFSDEVYKRIQNIEKQIHLNAYNLPSFSESSEFLLLEEYMAIKRFVLSCNICYFVDGSMTNRKNLIGYTPKFIMHTTLYAKNLIKLFRPYLADYFIDDWLTIIKNEGMEYVDTIKAEPGDIMSPHMFIREILNKDYRRGTIGF